MQVAGRVRQHLEHVEVRLGCVPRLAGSRRRRRARPPRPPATSSRLPVRRIASTVLLRANLALRNEKASRVRGRGEAARLSAAVVFLASGKQAALTAGSVTIEGGGCSHHGTPSSKPPPRHRAGRGWRARLGGVVQRARGPLRDPARRLRRGDAPRAGARLPRGGSGRARRLRDEGVPVGRGPADPRRGGARRRRLDGRRARVRRAAPGSRASASSSTGTTRRTSCSRAAAEAGALVVARLARGARPRARPSAAHAVPRPRDAGDRGRHARGGQDGAPRLEVRAAARRRARGAPPRARSAKGSTSTSARSSCTSARR